ncbi:MAG: hypothetical protein JXB47_09920 [Anaerolineae bacterium]|nr:hypothetical protein [Anaerolineae bacterium]
MSDGPSRRDFPLHTVGFYSGIGSVLLAPTHVFNFLPLPFMRPAGALAWLSIILGLGALALGFVARRQADALDSEDAEMARSAMIIGGAGVILFAALFVLGGLVGLIGW